MHVVEQRSIADAAVDVVWERVTSLDGINYELMPLMSMRPPYDGISVATVDVGQPVGRFKVRLFGIVPFDYDDMTIIAMEPGRSFHERSVMRTARAWEHQRTLTPLDSGQTEIHDRLSFTPRVPGTGRVQAWLVAGVFRHRHRRAAAFFRS